MKDILLNRTHLRRSLIFGSIGAIAYAAFAFVFIKQNNFDGAWWLYVGNGAFMAAIFFYTRQLTLMPVDGMSAMIMIWSGLLTTIIGVILALLLSLTVLFIMQPAIISQLPAQPLIDAPAQVIPDQGGTSIAFMIAINAAVVNFSSGSFISLLSAYALKRNQTKDRSSL